MRIYQSLGTGLWIHNGIGVNSNLRAWRILNFKAEGSQVSSTNMGGDLVEFGDPVPNNNNNIGGILCRNMELVNPVLGFAALHIAGNSGLNTSGVDCEGDITASPGDLGRGVQVDACQNCSLKEATNTAFDYNLLLGSPTTASGICALPSSSSLLGPGVIYDGNGAEGALSTCFPPGTPLVQYPFRQAAVANLSPTSTPTPQPTVSIATSAPTVSGTSPGTTLTLTGNVPVSLSPPFFTVLRSLQNVPPPSPPPYIYPTTIADTWDTAASFISGLGGAAANSQVYKTKICNQTNATETLSTVAMSGVTLTGTTSVAANGCLNLQITITSTSTPAITINGSS